MTEQDPKFGGGSGGDGNPTKDEVRHIDGTFSLTGNQVELVARPSLPPAPPKDTIISLLAVDMEEQKGSVNLHAFANLNLTAGPPPLPQMDQDAGGFGAITIQCSELQPINIKRGLIDGVDQQILLTQQGITIDGGVQPITIKTNSPQGITLSVAEGASQLVMTPESIKISFGFGISSIELGPAGITIQGLPLVKIN